MSTFVVVGAWLGMCKWQSHVCGLWRVVWRVWASARAMTTTGWVYSVKRIKECSGFEWAKVSWCEMTRKEGKGSRWTLSKFPVCSKKRKHDGSKRKVRWKTKEIKKRKKNRPHCTWVKRTSLTNGTFALRCNCAARVHAFIYELCSPRACINLWIVRSLLDVLSRIEGGVATHKMLRGLKHKSLLLKVAMCSLASLAFIKHALTIYYLRDC